ncbi:hypothetical protein Mapa_015220 [Marchantia paleacea]|nr:hypothetical protein Mapa_015220 [Marchantia paleacea]
MALSHRIVSEESVQRYVTHASERCVQDLLAASRPELYDDWKLYRIKRGVEISRRSQGPVMLVRGRSFVDVPPSQIRSLASAIETAKQWDPYFVEGQYLRSVQENLDLLRLVFSGGAGPLFRNREFIVYERRETMDDGTQVIAVASLPRELAAGIYPEESKLVRGLLMQSGWVIEQVEQSDACIVTYVAQVDPAGWLPKWLVNILSVKLVLVIDDLYRLAQSFK